MPDSSFAAPARTRVYLGCGARRIPGFIHVDSHAYPHVDHVCGIDRLAMFAEGSVELIYASHVLERFGRYRIFDVVSEWYRVLRPGGVLRLAGPDFAKAARYYLEHGDIP